MYRKPSPKRQAELSRRLEAMRRGKDRARMAREPEPRGPDLPLLRREVIARLKRAEWMQRALGLDVCLRGRVTRGEKPQVTLPAFGHDLRDPLLVARAPSDAKDSASAVSPRALHVLRVLRPRCFAQVGNPVVGPVAVNVVNHTCRPRAIHVQPSKPMRWVQRAADVDADVPVMLALAASGSAHKVGSKLAFEPSEHPRIRVIVQQFAQTRDGKIGGSHDAVPSQSGQRPTRVSALGGPRYFSLRKAYQRLPSPRSSFWGQNGYSARDEEDARRADLEMRSPLDALA